MVLGLFLAVGWQLLRNAFAGEVAGRQGDSPRVSPSKQGGGVVIGDQ